MIKQLLILALDVSGSMADSSPEALVDDMETKTKITKVKAVEKANVPLQ